MIVTQVSFNSKQLSMKGHYTYLCVPTDLGRGGAALLGLERVERRKAREQKAPVQVNCKVQCHSLIRDTVWYLIAT